MQGNWDREEHAAGYRTRFSAPILKAHHSWRNGWKDADTELLELARHNRIVADGREDKYADTWWLPLDTGGDARANGIPFDEERTSPWKEGWIEADVNLVIHGVETL